ncbi:tRNA (adenosine(37)-N6)-dimethylallyltransferase MiaA [Mangrovitalea sediminis]|uniref:tRNA (adenosine(37)-N6)-dimethylallyltransferase MiaA n=1 Tax=Mangrovitalea sediminis TaxID=1982043 RepID=UPI000BE4F500|nr:tRNA (adenosine(37)-N6)-dimethylallyltransferase MiaA [Mangrovitalea sediminis]
MSHHDSRPPAIFLMGPTASGKTDLAAELCEALPCDVISVDSAMIYRDMDIGTAKPTPDELARTPHRLIDIRDPAESYSAADFRTDALREMAEISAAGRIPLLVGGTMMYFKTLRQGIANMPAADQAIRARLESEASERGLESLHARLRELDPEAAEAIHPNNRQRLLRALEVIELSGRPISAIWRDGGDDNSQENGKYVQWREDGNSALPYNVLQIALLPEQRPLLHRRIDERFQKMLESGLIDEVAALKARGDLNLSMPSMRCVGYRQVWEYLDGMLDRSEMVERASAATRQLAKRQLTWLRGWPELHSLSSNDSGNIRMALKLIHAHTTLENQC